MLNISYTHNLAQYLLCTFSKRKKKDGNKKNRKSQNTAFSEGRQRDGQRSGNTIKVKAEKFGSMALQFDTLCSARRRCWWWW